jgi:hypothetical protein
MFSRTIFGTIGAIANSDHLVGALIITIAVCAMAEVARPLPFLNVAGRKPRLARFVVDRLPYMSFVEAGRFYSETLDRTIDGRRRYKDADVALLGCNLSQAHASCSVRR